MTDLEAGPKITLDALYGHGFGQGWLDVSCDVRGLRMRKGRTRGGPESWRARVPAGELNVTLSNDQGKYSVFDAESGSLALGENTIFRLRCEWKGRHHILYVGRVDTWQEVWTEATDTVQITCFDILATAAEQAGAISWYPGAANERSDRRVENLLGRIGLRSIPFYSEPDHVTCISPEINGRLDSSTAVLDEIHRTVLSGIGSFHTEPNPAAEADPLDLSVPVDSFVMLNAGRFNRVAEIDGYDLPVTPLDTSAANPADIAGPEERTSVPGIPQPKKRAAQGAVPTFTDDCEWLAEGNAAYRELEWAYLAYQIPSIVVVANKTPPVHRDAQGNESTPWAPATGIGYSSDAVRHKVIQLTDLRFGTNAQARTTAQLAMAILSEPKIEVTKLRLYPHHGAQIFDKLLGLRLQDHVKAVRNLRHGDHGSRIEVEALVEGFEIKLNPSRLWQQDGTATWDVFLILSPIVAEIEDLPTVPPDRPPSTRPPAETITNPAASISGSTVTFTFTYSGGGTRPDQGWEIHAQNAVTGTVQSLKVTNEANSGGSWTLKAKGGSLIAGVTYRLMVLDKADTDVRSASVTMKKPLPAPPKPYLTRQSAWESMPGAGTEAIPTVLRWLTAGANVSYELGVAKSKTGTLVSQGRQSALWRQVTLDLDADYSFAVRFTSGGSISPWSARFTVHTGRPNVIVLSKKKKLANTPSGDWNEGKYLMAEVPLIKLPAGWPMRPGITDNRNYFTDAAGNPGGFIGTVVDEMRLYLDKRDYSNVRVGPTLDAPAYGQMITQALRSVAWGQAHITGVANPSAGKRIPITNTVFDIAGAGKNVAERRFGIYLHGAGYHPGVMFLRGYVEVWGRTATAIAGKASRVI